MTIYEDLTDVDLFAELNKMALIISASSEGLRAQYNQACQELTMRFSQEQMLRLLETGKLRQWVVMPLLDDSNPEWYIRRVLHNPDNAIASWAASQPHGSPTTSLQASVDRLVKPVNIVREN